MNRCSNIGQQQILFTLQSRDILTQFYSDNSRHIILCGYITTQSVETFLRDFLHKDRSETAVNVVIMAK